MTDASRVVLMASYQAATSYVKYSKLNPDDIMVIDPALGLFGEYFATYAACHTVGERSSASALAPLLKKLHFGSVALWSYALSDIGLNMAHFAREQRVPAHMMFPSPFVDVLHASHDFDLRIALRTPRALLRMLLQKVRGYPLTLKTHSNYLFSCIDTRFASSITTFAELSARTEYAEPQFGRFVAFVCNKHKAVVDDLLAQRKVCILLDEELAFYHRLSGVHPDESKRVLSVALEKLRAQGFTVYLKPTYSAEESLSQLFPFAGIIPGEIPMEVLDIALTPGTVVTGFSSSYLETRPRNFRTVGIRQLIDEL